MRITSVSEKRGLVIIIAIVLVLFLKPIFYIMSSKEITITIKDKERITEGSGEGISSKFIVYDENEVFENTDSWLYFKFSSTDFQRKLDVGKTYNVKVAGWRFPLFSMYRNIVDIKE